MIISDENTLMKILFADSNSAVRERRRRGEGRRGLIPAGVFALAVYRFVKTSVRTSAPLCLPEMAQGQEGGTGYFNSAKVCLSRSKCRSVRVWLRVCTCLWDKRMKQREREREWGGGEKRKEVETSVPGQKAEGKRTEMTTLEYESRALGNLGS